MNILSDWPPDWIFVAGCLVGGMFTGMWIALWFRGQLLKALRDSDRSHATATAQVEELRTQLSTAQNEREKLEQEIRSLESQKVSAETTLQTAQESFEEKYSLLNEAKTVMSDTFRSLAAEALAGNNRGFLTLAEEKFKALKEETSQELEHRQTTMEALLQPLGESLRAYQRETHALEGKRLQELSAVSEQLRQLASAQSTLQTETAKLVNALRSPQTRGRWGEIALRKTAELAGMSAHCDFVEQHHVTTKEGGLRPDMVVKLPAGREVVVDSKVPLSAFLESLESSTDQSRIEALKRHTKQVSHHVGQLASKEYWEQFAVAPEFVILFIPNDSFLAAAAEQNPNLIEEALRQKVVIATPTTFIALLRAIAYGWRNEHLTQETQRISLLGQELADRMGILADHFSKIGLTLGKTVEAYNATVASLETRLFPTARKFSQLGVNPKKPIPEASPIDTFPQPGLNPESSPIPPDPPTSPT